MAALPAVSTSDLQPGDLLFFDGDGHVGMYVGGGYLIDAPQTGSDVEKVPLSGWYARTWTAPRGPEPPSCSLTRHSGAPGNVPGAPL